MIAHIEVSSWCGISLGATHYQATFRPSYTGNQYISLDVVRILTKREALALNKNERQMGRTDGRKYRAGDECGQFLSEQEAINAGIEFARAYEPTVTVLLLGSSSILDPQPVLFAPSDIEAELKRLHEVAEACGGYEGDEEQMERLFKQWHGIMKARGFR